VDGGSGRRRESARRRRRAGYLSCEWRRMIAMHARYRTAGYLLCRRVHESATGGGHDRKGSDPLRAALGDLSLVTVFSLHMLGAIPNAGHISNSPSNRMGGRAIYFAPPLQVRDGCVAIPDGQDGASRSIPPGWRAPTGRPSEPLDHRPMEPRMKTCHGIELVIPGRDNVPFPSRGQRIRVVDDPPLHAGCSRRRIPRFRRPSPARP